MVSLLKKHMKLKQVNANHMPPSKCKIKPFVQEWIRRTLCVWKVSTHLLDTPFLIHGVQYAVGPPFAAITATTLLGRLSRRFRSGLMGMFDHSSRSAFVRSHTYLCDLTKKTHWTVGQEGLAPPVWFTPNVFYRVEVRTLCRPHQTMSSMKFWTLFCAHLDSPVGRRRGQLQTVPTKTRGWNCPNCLGMMKHSKLRGQAVLLKNKPESSPCRSRFSSWSLMFSSSAGFEFCVSINGQRGNTVLRVEFIAGEVVCNCYNFTEIAVNLVRLEVTSFGLWPHSECRLRSFLLS